MTRTGYKVTEDCRRAVYALDHVEVWTTDIKVGVFY